MQTSLQQTLWLLSKSTNPEELALIITQRAVATLYQNPTSISNDIYLWLILNVFEIVPKALKDLKEWVLYQDDERKFSVPIMLLFLRTDIISMHELDMQLARMMESGKPWVSGFTIALIRQCVLGDKKIAAHSDFMHSIEFFTRQVQKGKRIEGAEELLGELSPTQLAVRLGELDIDDPEVDQQVRHLFSLLFKEWVQLCYHSGANEMAQKQFISQLISHGFLKNDLVNPLFFRICCELCVESYYASLQQSPPTAYQPIDAFARLLVLLVAQYIAVGTEESTAFAIGLAGKVLSIIVLVLSHAHESAADQFNQKPFFRLFSTLLNDFKLYQTQMGSIYIQLLSEVSNTMHAIQPQVLPAFTFSWLQLISHRNFMAPILLAADQALWPNYHRLLVSLFKYMAPALAGTKMPAPLLALYKANLRILLVLLHDFPEFLCEYHFSLIDVIPHSCIQLRNLILSAFPRNMRLPDPFTTNLKVDLLPEMNQPPRILCDYTASLEHGNLKHDVDSFLKSRTPASFLADLPAKLVIDDKKGGNGLSGRYNVPVINSLVLYVGVQAIAQAQAKVSAAILRAPMDIYQRLCDELDNEGIVILTQVAIFCYVPLPTSFATPTHIPTTFQ